MIMFIGTLNRLLLLTTLTSCEAAFSNLPSKLFSVFLLNPLLNVKDKVSLTLCSKRAGGIGLLLATKSSKSRPFSFIRLRTLDTIIGLRMNISTALLAPLRKLTVLFMVAPSTSMEFCISMLLSLGLYCMTDSNILLEKPESRIAPIE